MEGKESPERNECLKLTIKTSREEKLELEEIVITPRRYDALNENGGSSSANDLSFDMDEDSLSSPSLSEDEAHYPLMNMGRNHQDNFTFDDEEDLLRSGTFSMSRISRIPDARDVTSPTLTQLSTESIPNTMSLGSLCSPAKMSMDKPLFESPSPLKREADSEAFKRSLNHSSYGMHRIAGGGERNAASTGGLPDNIRAESEFQSQTSLLSSDRYNIDETTNIANSVTSNHVFISTNNTTWTTKFTLPTRNEQIPNSGFIRVGPSSSVANSIYSPPFTSPPSHSKAANIFKFENSSKAMDNDFVVHPRDPPSYSTAVQDKALMLDKRYDAEPPLQKVNPDIFLSTMFTVPSSSSS